MLSLVNLCLFIKRIIYRSCCPSAFCGLRLMTFSSSEMLPKLQVCSETWYDSLNGRLACRKASTYNG
jgi:hypothetical protein